MSRIEICNRKGRNHRIYINKTEVGVLLVSKFEMDGNDYTDAWPSLDGIRFEENHQLVKKSEEGLQSKNPGHHTEAEVRANFEKRMRKVSGDIINNLKGSIFRSKSEKRIAKLNKLLEAWEWFEGSDVVTEVES